MNRTVVLSGMAAALGGLVLVGGCSTEVMGERRYIPAPVEDTAVPMTPAAPVQQESVTVVETEEAVPAELPRFDEFVGTTSGSVSEEKDTQPAVSVPEKPVAKGGVYVVKAGDSCYKIARAHKVSLRALMAANGLTAATASRLQIGQKLTIPEGGKYVAPQNSGKKSSSGAAASSGKVTLSDDGYYIVQPGDNVPKIARKLGVKWSELMKVNNITEESARRLQIGQKLVVPGRTPAGASTAVAEQKTAEDKKTSDALDEVSNVLDEVKNSGTAPTPTTDGATATAPVNATPDATAASGETAPTVVTETVQEEVVSGASVPVEIKADITIEKFAADNKISVDTFKKLNEGSLPPDGMLRTGSIVFIPSAE